VDVFGFCEVPDPLLAIYIPILNASFQSGQCFGFSLTTLRFLNGQQSLSNYPLVSGGKDIWHLNGPALSNGQNVSPKLSHYIHLQHILQASAEAIHAYLVQAAGSHTWQGIKQSVTNALSTQGAILCMSSGGGHCVTPYAVEAIPNSNDYTIETYNPNNPYSPGENHDSAISTGRITVKSSNNTYMLGDGKEHSGGLTDITVFPYGLFANPTPPVGFGILDVVFGATEGTGARTTQVSDSAGHRLLNANGTPNTDPKTRIPNSAVLPRYGALDARNAHTLTMVLARNGTYTQTIENHAVGNYHLHLAGKDFGVLLQNVPSKAGDRETLTYSPTNNHFGFNTSAASKPFDVQVLARHADKSVRTAHVTGTSLRNAGLEMSFDANKETFVYRHAGAPGQINVRLLHTVKRATTETKLAPIAVNHGDVVTFAPHWKTMKSADPGMIHHKDATGALKSRKLE
jgi:hypothetical protein